MADRAARNRDELAVLLLCDTGPSHAPNVVEHIRAFQLFSRHRLDIFNPLGVRHSRLLRLGDYDVVVLHYTVFVLSDKHLSPWFQEQLASFGGLKVQFIQDEYRRVDAMTARMRELGIDLLFSSIPVDAVPQVYGQRLPGVDVVPTLTGFVPAALEQSRRRPLQDRSTDVAYRGRSVPYWLGRLGQEKVLIGREFLRRAASTNLRCDIAWTEADRIYGDAWYEFLGSSRTTLGTESGASIVDFDGSLEELTDAYVVEHPEATFDELERELLARFEGNAVIQTISPRVFEAAALGTGMVNFNGRYSGVIEPWIHFIPLEKDFSNFEEVVAAIQDDAVLERVAARAHSDLVASERYSLRRFVQDFEHEVEARVQPVQRRPRSRVVNAASRKLIALEQLGTPARLVALPAVASLRTRAVNRAGRRLLRRFPEIGDLGANELSAAARSRLEHDAARLAAAAAAHVRELRYYGPAFDVRLELGDEDRKLMLVSSPAPSQDESERSQMRDRIESAIRDGRLEEIVWNHSAVAGYLKFPVLVVGAASLVVGYHVVNGAHRFTAVEELARRDPERVIAAFAPLFRPRPNAPVHELHGPLGALQRLLSSPGHVGGRGAAAIRAALATKELRRLLRAYLRSSDARAEAPLDLLLEDLFKLSLVAQAQIQAELTGDRTTLLYRTSAGGANGGVALDPETVSSLRRIVWDNSSADSLVTSNTRPRVSVMLPANAHDFQALTLVARRFPALAAPALRRAAGSG